MESKFVSASRGRRRYCLNIMLEPCAIISYVQIILKLIMDIPIVGQ